MRDFYEDLEDPRDETDVGLYGKDPNREYKPWARKLWTAVEPEQLPEDIIIPERTARLLDAVIVERKNKRTLKKWGFDGRGMVVLFVGPSGTGKTMAAGIIARRLKKTLLIVRADKVGNNYVHGTQENMGRLFDEAGQVDAVLFIDEADGLLGRRVSEVRCWQDVQHNADIEVFLQRVEEYEGLLILATNFPQSLDFALERRIDLEVPFGVPDKEERRLLWDLYLTRKAPLSLELDLDEIADRYALTGANIKNAARQAARFALLRAGACAVISHRDVTEACRMELTKQGRAAASGNVSEIE